MAIETRSDVHGFGDTVPAPAAVKQIPTMAQSFGLLLARVPLGAYFVVAGFKKLYVDGKFDVKGGVEAFVNQASGLIPSWVPQNLGQMYLKALPFAEMVLGGLLIIGFLSRFVAALLSLMLISFIIALPEHASGALGPSVNLPFHPNVIYVGLALALVFCGAGRLSLDGLLFGPRRAVTITERYTEPLT
jgi:uncharacterized membrane protein YphA (DoxX/SURF4 family)